MPEVLSIDDRSPTPAKGRAFDVFSTGGTGDLDKRVSLFSSPIRDTRPTVPRAYVLWTLDSPQVSSKEVAKIRKDMEARTAAFTVEELKKLKDTSLVALAKRESQKK